MKYSLNSKVLNERSNYRIYCECGHSLVILPFEHKKRKLCRHCGKYVYISKKEEFKDRLGVIL